VELGAGPKGPAASRVIGIPGGGHFERIADVRRPGPQQGALNLFGIGSQELLIIFLVVLLLFGADRIPEVARALGKGIRDVKRAAGEFESEIQEISRQKDELIGKGVDPGGKPASGQGSARAKSVPSIGGEAGGGGEAGSKGSPSAAARRSGEAEGGDGGGEDSPDKAPEATDSHGQERQ